MQATSNIWKEYLMQCISAVKGISIRFMLLSLRQYKESHTDHVAHFADQDGKIFVDPTVDLLKLV